MDSVKQVTMSDQNTAQQPEEDSKGLAALFQEGVASINTKRSNDLFKELDKRDLTVDEESIIKQRVEHQRRMLEEYERREESRKVRELVDVCGGNVTEDEAKYALKQYGGREDDAASALVSQGSFLAKVKNIVSGVPMPVAPPRAPAGERKRPRQTRPSVNQMQTLTSSSTCDANIFVGSFRGKLQPVAAGGCGRNSKEAEAAEGSSAPEGGPQGAAEEQHQQLQPPPQEQQEEGGPAEAHQNQEEEEVETKDDAEQEAEDPKPRHVAPVRKGRATRQRANPRKWDAIHGKIKAGEALDESAAALAATEKGPGDTGPEEAVDGCEPQQKAEEESKPLEEAKEIGGAAAANEDSHGSGVSQLVNRKASNGAEVTQHQHQQQQEEHQEEEGEEEEAAGTDLPGPVSTAEEPGKVVPETEGGSGSEGARATRAARISSREPKAAVGAPDEAPVSQEGPAAAAEEQKRNVRTRGQGESLRVAAAEDPEEGEKAEVKPLPKKRGQKRSRAAQKGGSEGGGEDGGKPAAKGPAGGKRKRAAAGAGAQRGPKRPVAAEKAKEEAAAAEEGESGSGSGSGSGGASEVAGCPGRSSKDAADGAGKAVAVAEAAQAAGALSPPHPPAGPSGGAASPAAASDGPGAAASSASSAEARSREPLRTLAVPINKPRLGRVKRSSSKKVDLIEVGSLKLERGWHNSGYIFPAGFKSRTVFRSSVDPTQLCVHECEIIGEGGQFSPAPTFRVVALDRPEWALVAKSATGCWNAVLSRINAEIRRRIDAGEDWPPPPKTAIAGPEYFGLSHPAIVEQIEQLDPERLCTSYWHGKKDREVCLSGGTPAARPAPPPPPPRAAPAPPAPRPPKNTTRRGGAGRGAARRAEREPEDMEAMIASNRWSSMSRAERYRNRYGDAAAEEMGQDNPLPDSIDPITLEKVISPAISPYGHVMGHATWMAVLAEQGKCPFTQKPLRRDQITVLTKCNIERHRSAIVSL